MTKETDKLAALLGVAKEAAIFFEDEFLVGLWRKRLWRDLLWWVKEPDKCTRSEAFNAPTWTWASVNGPISYELRGHDGDLDLDQCIEIVYAEAESNHTLSILIGRIVVRGKLVTMMPQGPQNASKISSVADAPPPSWKEDIEGTNLALVRCLIVAVSTHYVYALGLVALDDIENHYRRVGVVHWRADPHIFGWDTNTRNWKDKDKLLGITIL